MNKDYNRYIDYQVSIGSLDRNSQTLSASLISSIVNGCYVVSSELDIPEASTCVPGDVVVVSGTIGNVDGLLACSAYYCTGNNWKALVENYKAEEVYFDNDLQICANWLPSVDFMSSTIISAKGQSLNWLLSNIVGIADSSYSAISACSSSIDYLSTCISANANSISTKIWFDDKTTGKSNYNDLSIVKLSASEYYGLLTSDSLLSNALYVVNDNHIDAYGQQIKNIAKPVDLSDATTKEYVDNAIPTDLSSFTNSQGYLTKTSADNCYLSSNALDDYKTYANTVSSLSSEGYLLSSQISSKIEQLDKKIFIDNRVSGISGYSDLSIIKLPINDYAEILASNSALSNAIYIIDSNYVDAYGQQIKNIAKPVDLSDAATKEYVDNLIAKPQVDVDWAELTTLVEASSLVPGQEYRIVDYVTTTKSSSAYRSAGHQFDLIVVADSSSVLNEKARATLHAGDTYLSVANLAAWQVWYCIDNDENRFEWADSTNGKGVIYRLIDEFNNDCPYDFKNIQFNIDSNYYYTFNFNNQDLKPSEDRSTYWKANKVASDATIHNNTIERLLSGSTQLLNGIVFKDIWLSCCSNVFEENCKDIILSVINQPCCSNLFKRGNRYHRIDGRSYVNNRLYEDCYGILFKDGCYGNVIGANCKNLTFGSQCVYNVFGNYCDAISLDIRCSDNSFGIDCGGSMLGSYCMNNVFKNSCYGNILGQQCCQNVFGFESENNTIGNGCYYNIFNSKCRSNSLADDCHSNVFSDNCLSNTFRNACDMNMLGNNCKSNSFGNRCTSNSFGNDCASNILSSDCKSNSFGNNCISNVLNNGCESNSFGDYCETNEFANNCLMNTLGKQCISNILEAGNQTNEFGDQCMSNKLGYLSYSNRFGSGCVSCMVGDGTTPTSFVCNVEIKSDNKCICLHPTMSTSISKYYQNVTIDHGVNTTSTIKMIDDHNAGQQFATTYCPKNSQTISI